MKLTSLAVVSFVLAVTVKPDFCCFVAAVASWRHFLLMLGISWHDKNFFFLYFHRITILTNKLNKGRQLCRGTKGLQAKINLIKRYSSEVLECFCISYCSGLCLWRLAGWEWHVCSFVQVSQLLFLRTKCPVTSDWGGCEYYWIISWILPTNCFCIIFPGCMNWKWRILMK